MTDVDKLLEGISTLVRSELEDSPKLSGTEFQILVNAVVVDATCFYPGVLMNMVAGRSFASLIASWIACSGETYNDYEFAELARKCNGKVMVIHGGL